MALQPPKYTKDFFFKYPRCTGVFGELIKYPHNAIPTCQDCHQMALDSFKGYDFRVEVWKKNIWLSCHRFDED